MINQIIELIGSIPRRLGVTRERFGPTGYFLMRELFHLLGGAVVGILPRLTLMISIEAWSISITIISALLGLMLFYSETRDVMRDQSLFKTLADILAWYAGFILCVIPYGGL